MLSCHTDIYVLNAEKLFNRWTKYKLKSKHPLWLYWWSHQPKRAQVNSTFTLSYIHITVAHLNWFEIFNSTVIQEGINHIFISQLYLNKDVTCWKNFLSIPGLVRSHFSGFCNFYQYITFLTTLTHGQNSGVW